MRISIPSTYPLGPSFQDNGADRNAKKTRCETSGDSLRMLDTSRALDASYGGVPADKENLPGAIEYLADAKSLPCIFDAYDSVVGKKRVPVARLENLPGGVRNKVASGTVRNKVVPAALTGVQGEFARRR